MSIELWRYEELHGSWPDTEPLKALAAFWDGILDHTWDPEARWHGWRLLLPGRPPIRLNGDEVARSDLWALIERRREPGFREHMVRLHLGLPATGSLDLAPLLAVPPHLPAVDELLSVLRTSLGGTAPLVHLGAMNEPRDVPPGATFTVTTRFGHYPNGAGCMTMIEEWSFNLYQPLRLHLEVVCSDEEGSASDWSCALWHPAGIEVEALVVALRTGLPWLRLRVDVGA
jgi:hypothetical protein